jgi:hypothetical protein
MTVDTLIVLAPSAVAILVTWMTFQYALLREQRQWSREQRAQVYVDLLVEASAEQTWLEDVLSQADMRPEDRTPFPDHRMDGRERRRLGARVNAYGSQEVLKRHKRLRTEITWAIPPYGGRDEAQRASGMVRTKLAFDALEAQIRLELEGEQGAPRWRRPQVARDPFKGVPLPAFRREPWAPPPEQGEEG